MFFFRFYKQFRELNGRNSAQSSELCARPGVIAQTLCSRTVKREDVCLCCVRKLYMSSGAIPYGGTKTKGTYRNDMFFFVSTIIY